VAAKRGKSQAKRNNGNGGALPGWAWMVLGILLAVVVILVAPKYLKSDGDGFFRPQPNPDAQPAPVASGDDEGVVSDESAGDDKAPARKGDDTATTKKDTDYDFYTLLPGKEVPMSDAELAASERAEARQAQAAKPQSEPEKPAVEKDTAATLPKPVDAAVGASTEPASASSATANAPTTETTPAKASPDAPTATAAAPADDNTRYLLQAGAFQASGQAEEMKAKIAMLGLGARVESASIGGKTVYRVRMGPYGTASDLADAKRKLSSGGLAAMAIKVK